jgi:RNA polymerase sigma-70 factor (ECF subfamily)
MTVLEGKALLDHGKAIARRYARRVGPEVAEDLRAEAVLRALHSPPPDGRMEPWLERIYRNLFVDLWRRGQLRNVALDDVPELASSGTPEDETLLREQRRLVREGLGRLPREARRALLSRYYGELDDAAAAARFGIAATTVRTRIHRALARLRAHLGDLRGWFPPIFGKWGAQAATVGLAPIMLAALVVVSTSATTPVPAPAPSTVGEIAPRPAQRPSAISPRTETPAVMATPPAPVRLVRRAASAAPSAEPPSPPAAIVALDDGEPIVREILQPEAIDVFAEPEPPAARCLVEVPGSFAPQIEKMIEEQL